LPLRRETKQPIKAYEPKEKLMRASGNRNLPDVDEYLVELHPLDALGCVFGLLCLSLPPPPALIVSTLRPGLWHADSASSYSCCTANSGPGCAKTSPRPRTAGRRVQSPRVTAIMSPRGRCPHGALSSVRSGHRVPKVCSLDTPVCGTVEQDSVAPAVTGDVPTYNNRCDTQVELHLGTGRRFWWA
jgi:hypothetical protein